jgi:hypothetical protein
MSEHSVGLPYQKSQGRASSNRGPPGEEPHGVTPMRSLPCRRHADYFVLHGFVYKARIISILLGLLARPERFERPTPRFVVCALIR